MFILYRKFNKGLGVSFRSQAKMIAYWSTYSINVTHQEALLAHPSLQLGTVEP